jgi:hypothetical protein
MQITNTIDNPFCHACREDKCLISDSHVSCAMIMVYLKVVTDRERRAKRRTLLEGKGYKLTGKGRAIPPEPRYDEVYSEGVKQLDRS